MIELSAIYRYPIKSCRGESAFCLPVNQRGFAYDRHWMIVDRQGRFLTQRQYPQMALISTKILSSGLLQIQVPHRPPLIAVQHSQEKISVQIWRDQCTAQLVSLKVDAYLSDYLGIQCHLVYLPEHSHRPVDPNYARPEDEVGFADGFPFLLISEASLQDLNQRMGLELPMIRFRPNLVVSGCEPYAEDHWRRIRIGEIEFEVAKPCSRCVIPTIDPETGQRSGEEPLKTLLSYRKQGNAVYFGQNLIHRQQGELKLHLPVEILD